MEMWFIMSHSGTNIAAAVFPRWRQLYLLTFLEKCLLLAVLRVIGRQTSDMKGEREGAKDTERPVRVKKREKNRSPF